VTAAIDRDDIERFRAAVARRLGLQFDETRVGFLGEVLQRRLTRMGGCAAAYLHELETGAATAEPALLAQELTVGESYFFRNSEQFHALADIVVPERMRKAGATKRLRILSAGCASGEEPYSIGILLREAIPEPEWTIEVRAVDLNPLALERAMRARYSSWALRETPLEIQRKWFRPEGRDLALDDAARIAVQFHEQNLAVDDARFWQPQVFDVIFCRNVLMYFSPDQAGALLSRIARALQAGGYLFLGHAETLRGISDDFHLRHTHGTFYYQLKDIDQYAPSRPSRAAVAAIPAGAGDSPDVGASWVEVIGAASDRVTALAAGSKASAPVRLGQSPRRELATAIELLRTERFAEALACVRSLPPAAARDPDVLLLTAALLAHSGEPAAAEQTCRRLLLIDELNAGAHYVFALCREAAGDRSGAVEHDRVAAYLDSAFAMPRLHLGLLARRAGDREAARRELGQALILLRREDASRLLLFGGGFSRDALLALCGSALRDCGGEP